MKRFFLFILFIQMFPAVFAQQSSDKPLRIELTARSSEESHRVIPCGKSGAVLFFKSVEREKDTLVKWYFTFYDKDLKQVWLKTVGINDNMIFIDSKNDDNSITFLFATAPKEKNPGNDYLILNLNPSTSEFSGIRGNFQAKVDSYVLERTSQYFFIGYNVKNQSAVLLITDRSTGAVISKPVSEGTYSVITSILADTSNNRIFCSLKKSFAKNKYEYFLTGMDYSGNIISDRMIRDGENLTDDERYILDLQVLPFSSDSVLAYGIYRTGALKSSEKNAEAIPATGLFTILFNGDKIVNSVFTNFLSLQNTYYPGKSNISSLQKKASRQNKDLTEYSLDFSAVVHPAVLRNDTVLLLSELFSPQFHTENYTDFDFYGRPYTNSYRVFDGYHFTNGILTAFDKSGNLIWDNSMEIMNLSSFDPSSKISLSLSDTAQMMCYLTQGKIGYKLVNENKVLEKLDFAQLEMMSPEEKMIDESRASIKKWYGNYYLCYGYQEIKNINASENRKRMVFYLTKVRFD